MLKSVNYLHVSPLGGSIDPSLERVNVPFDLWPGDVPPFLHSGCPCAHDASILEGSILRPSVTPSAYPSAFPKALASGSIPPPCSMRLTGCFFVKRKYGGYRVPDHRLSLCVGWHSSPGFLGVKVGRQLKGQPLTTHQRQS